LAIQKFAEANKPPKVTQGYRTPRVSIEV